MKKKKTLLQKWNELNVDLQGYFGTKALILCGIILAEVLIDLSTRNSEIFFFLLTITLFYICWIGFFLIMAFKDKILMFEGICEKVSVKKKEINRPIAKNRVMTEIYGKSTVTMVISITNEGVTEEAKFVVPVPGNTDIEENYVIRVYTLESSIITKNDNTFEITNPLLVKIARN